jgi:chromosome segregation ATPase
MAAMETRERSYKSPVGKLLAFFRDSRDRWKAKHHELKRQLKREQNQLRAVEKSRATWRDKAQTAIQQVQTLQRELAELKKCTGTSAVH